MDSVKGHQRGSRTLAVCFNFCLHSITHNFFFAVFFICQPAKQCRILSMTNRHSTNRTVTGRKAAGNALTTWLQIDQWSFLHMSLQWKKRNFFFFFLFGEGKRRRKLQDFRCEQSIKRQTKWMIAKKAYWLAIVLCPVIYYNTQACPEVFAVIINILNTH